MKHEVLESKALWMVLLATFLVAIGGLVEIVPLYAVPSSVPPIASVKPYTPMELEGRDIYIREGCYNCHSQMVRPFRDETERYGPVSRAGEFVYDRPFQWGSKRTGPDLHRVGGKYPDSWHYMHMKNPRDVSPDSIMPSYPWLLTSETDVRDTRRKMEVLRQLGTPYTQEDIDNWRVSFVKQGDKIAFGLQAAQIRDIDGRREIVALIAFLQRLGTDIGWRQP